MRPQLIRRARRGIAALGALALAVGVFGTVASASITRTHRPPRQLTPPRPRRHTPPRPQPRARRLHLRAQMLHPNVLVGKDVAFIGATRPGIARRPVGIDERRGARWVEVARTVTGAHGHFLARYWPRQLGRIRLRVRLAAPSGRRVTVLEPVATVYRAVVASWYGPGGTTACGETLGAGTQGVASRTLPCGRLVTLRYRNRSVRVPVIDRGPYVAGREYDLTYATKLALGAGDVSLIWASA